MKNMEGIFDTTSISFASYLNRVKGYELIDHKKVNDRLTFYFKGSEEIKRKLKQEYLDSDCKKYNNGIWDFTKLLRD